MSQRRVFIKPGTEFGRLTIVKFFGTTLDYHQLYRCQCSCGRFTVVRASELRRGCRGSGRGGTSSCGCLRRENGKLSAQEHNRQHNTQLELSL